VLDPGQPQLSSGELRRLALARACLRDSAIWILDEPTAGLDPHSAAATSAALRRRAADRAMLVISHDPDRYPWADRHLLLSEGRLLPAPYPVTIPVTNAAVSGPRA
jgi:ABC-type transport system involved in cytochrome bd biosynthesis fused ATPase/permease subunit